MEDFPPIMRRSEADELLQRNQRALEARLADLEARLEQFTRLLQAAALHPPVLFTCGRPEDLPQQIEECLGKLREQFQLPLPLPETEIGLAVGNLFGLDRIDLEGSGEDTKEAS